MVANQGCKAGTVDILLNLGTSLKAIHNRHVDVQKHSVKKVYWLTLGDLVRLQPIFCFKNLEKGFEFLFKGFQEKNVVVGYQNSRLDL